jgi:hypothetical protein
MDASPRKSNYFPFWIYFARGAARVITYTLAELIAGFRSRPLGARLWLVWFSAERLPVECLELFRFGTCCFGVRSYLFE